MGRGKGTALSLPPPPPLPRRRPLMDAVPPPDPKRPRPPTYLYHPHRLLDLDRLLPPSTPLRLIHVLIPSEFATSSHPPLRARQLWGGHPYTDDSDLVAALAHSGVVALPSVTHTSLDYLLAELLVVRHTRARGGFPSVVRNGLCSRSWGDAYDGAAMYVERVFAFSADASTQVKAPLVAAIRAGVRGLSSWGEGAGSGVGGAAGTGVIETPAKRGRGAGGAVVVFDLGNEVCAKYELGAVEGWNGGDCVLYVEGDGKRFEVWEEKGEYRFARVKAEVVRRLMMSGVGEGWGGGKFPMKRGEVEIIAEGLMWKELYWDPEGLTVRRKHYPLTKMFFREAEG